LPRNITLFEALHLGVSRPQTSGPSKNVNGMFTKIVLSNDVNKITKCIAHVRTTYQFLPHRQISVSSSLKVKMLEDLMTTLSQGPPLPHDGPGCSNYECIPNNSK
jgi:hypothetical protein